MLATSRHATMFVLFISFFLIQRNINKEKKRVENFFLHFLDPESTEYSFLTQFGNSVGIICQTYLGYALVRVQDEELSLTVFLWLKLEYLKPYIPCWPHSKYFNKYVFPSPLVLKTNIFVICK